MIPLRPTADRGIDIVMPNIGTNKHWNKQGTQRVKKRVYLVVTY
jgi:hypothetical protein